MTRAMYMVASLLLAASSAAGQGVPGSFVELWFGPVVAPAGVIGRGGASVVVADGAGDMLLNPAAVASRYRHTADRWFDWDIAWES